MASVAITRRVLAICSVVLVISVVVAAFLPAQPDGRITGPLGIATAIVAFAALFGAWIAAIWHASVSPWRATAPRWLVILLLVFGSGVAGVLYYVLYAHWQRPDSQFASRAA